MAEQPAQVGTLQRYLMQAEREMAELQEQLEEVNKQNSISCDALDLAATRHDDELRAVGTERDSLRAQLTEAQRENEALRAERDRLREELTRFLQWECGELAMSERLPQQSPTSDSPATAAQAPRPRRDCPHCGPGRRFDEDGCCGTCGADTVLVVSDIPARLVDRLMCPRCGSSDRWKRNMIFARLAGSTFECANDWHSDSPAKLSDVLPTNSEDEAIVDGLMAKRAAGLREAKLGGAVSREELVEALRLPGAHGPVEYALNRVATALERGGKTDG